MYSLNRAQIIGNVTRDPEVRQTSTGQQVCTFGVATNRSWNDAAGVKQEEVEFHNVVAWGKLAEICGQYLSKGRKVYVDGRLKTRDWEGQDGAKRRTTEIITENLIILDKGPATPISGSAPAAPSASGFAPRAASPFAPAAPKADPAPNPDDEIKVEDIPF